MSKLPIKAKNTPYFLIVKQGKNTGNILEAYVRIGHIYEFLAWIKSKNPFYAGIAIDFEALNRCPDNDIYDNVFICDDKNIYDERNMASANYYNRNMISSMTITPS